MMVLTQQRFLATEDPRPIEETNPPDEGDTDAIPDEPDPVDPPKVPAETEEKD